MRAPISVIVPTLNSERHLSACLSSLMAGVEAGLIRELIVSDGGSSDATVAIAKEWGAHVITCSTSRGGQLKQGCESAQGRWLMVLHADTVLSDDWVGHVISHLSTNQAGWFNLAFDTRGVAARLVAGWANVRSRAGLPYGDQGLLIPSALYHSVGGYADQPLMEDVAIARALKGHLLPIGAIATTSAAKFVHHGWVRRGGRNLWTLLRYFGGTSPERLASDYRR